MKKTLLSLLIGLGVSSQVLADDLYQIYQQALKNDPTTLQAQANKDASYAAISTSRAQLLPQITLDLDANRTNGDLHRETNDFTVSFRQSIYDHSNWRNLERAELVASQSDATYGNTKQTLITRTSQAYFDILQAKDDLEFALAEKRAIERQLEQTKQRFEVGLTAITDVHEAQAQFDNAVASEISARNNVEIRLEALREITGDYYANISVLDTTKFSANMPTPSDLKSWLALAEERNLELLAAKMAVDIAKEDVSVARAGHLPTVTLSGRYNSNDTDGIASDPGNAAANDRFNTNTIALNVNVPLYQGGSVEAEVKRARHAFVASSEDRERIYRSVVRNVRTNFYDVTAAIPRIKALQQAVVSAESALKATEAGFEVGTRTIVDVLDSTRNLYDAKRNLSSARYSFINSVLNLKLAAGTLDEQDILAINQGLASN